MKKRLGTLMIFGILIWMGASNLTACGKSATTSASPGATQLFPNINP